MNTNMNTDIEKAVNFWLKCVKDNLQTAEAMIKTGRWSFAMFMCQQTLEALLKAVFIITSKKRPEYIHKLPKLLQLTGIKVPKAIDLKILKIDAHYISARYQEERFNKTIYNRKNATQLVKDVKEIMKWFARNLKLRI